MITLNTKRSANIANLDNREYLIAMEATNAKNDTISSMLIFKEANLVMHK